MGSSASTNKVLPHTERDIPEIVDAMMPLYYVRKMPSRHHVTTARKSWDLLDDGLSPVFCDLRRTHGFQNESFSAGEGKTIFKNEFVSRMFDIYPTSKPMFSKIQHDNPGWCLVIADLCLNQLDDSKGFLKHTMDLTKMYVESGVCAVQYGNIGEVFLWTLKRCLGSAWNRDVELSWKYLFSALLRIMVPVAVNYELTTPGYSSKFKNQQVSKVEMAMYRSSGSFLDELSASFATFL